MYPDYLYAYMYNAQARGGGDGGAGSPACVYTKITEDDIASIRLNVYETCTHVKV